MPRSINPPPRSLILPSEHGGWSLTLEPAILGLIVAPGPAGVALAGAALAGFLARTPLRVILIDHHRRRSLERTRAARWILGIELTIIIALGLVAAATAAAAWWSPLVPAAVLVAIELGYDVRSRSRRLVPELAGSIGIGAIAAAIALGGGEGARVAYGLWLVMATRTVAAVPFVRLQLRRAKGQAHRRWTSDLGQIVAAVAVGVGSATGVVPRAAAGAIVGLGIVHCALSRRPPPAAAVVGAQQVVLGLTVVLIAGLAAAAP